MKRLSSLLVLACVLGQGLAQAQERSNVDGPAILGNQELPKVLYIVPWKKPVQTEVAGKGFVSVVNEDLVPIDREVFLRQVQFQSQLQARQQPKSAP